MATTTDAEGPRKLTEEELRELESSGSAPEGASAWNHAGTFEEKAVTSWAKERVTAKLKGYTREGLTITDVASISGDAHIWIVRGKKRCGFEFEMKLAWTHTAAGGKEVQGFVKVPSVASDDLDELETVPELKDSKAAASAEGVAAVKAAKGLAVDVRRLLEEFLEEMKVK